jgi:hypothetical protein
MDRLLSGFPADIKRHFLSKWIEVKDLCKLDTSFCNITRRSELLFDLNELIISGVHKSDESFIDINLEQYLKWLVIRNFHPINLQIVECSINIIHYITMYEVLDHLKSLKISAKNNFYGLIKFFT